jgi:prepilin-type processing-associated H-X9-DG protein
MPRNVSGMPISRAPNPSKAVLLFEKGTQPVGGYADATGEYFDQTTGSTVRQIMTNPNNQGRWGTPHSNGKAFLFVDGHSKWYPGVTKADLDNPFGYYYGSAPVNGSNLIGYCGGRIAGSPQPAPGVLEWGANLPK